MHEQATHNSNGVLETRDTYCQPGFRDLLTSYYVSLCAASSALGRLIFGYDQGVVSVILVEPQFMQTLHACCRRRSRRRVLERPSDCYDRAWGPYWKR